MADLYMGLDLSLTAPGVAVVRKNLTVSYVNVIDSGTKKGLDRLLNIVDTIHDDVVDNGFTFVVAIEGYAMATKGRKFDTAEMIGAVKVMLYRTRRFISLAVPPDTLKVYAANNGRAEKPEMVEAARRRFDYDVTDHNAADALHLAAFARDWDMRASLPKRQSDALGKAAVLHPLPFPRSPTVPEVRRRTPVQK